MKSSFLRFDDTRLYDTHERVSKRSAHMGFTLTPGQFLFWLARPRALTSFGF